MRLSVRSKKMAALVSSRRWPLATGQLVLKMVRIGLMARRIFPISRRALLAGFGAAAGSRTLPWAAAAGQPQRLAWQVRKTEFSWPALGAASLGWSSKFTPVWSLTPSEPVPRFDVGQLDAALQNSLPQPAALTWRGLDGAPATEPLLGSPSLAANATQAIHVPLRHAGTMFCDLGLLADGQPQPSRGQPFIVSETEPPPVDRDEVVLIEEWRVRRDGIAIAPGTAPGDTEVFHTVNDSFGSDLPGVPVRANQRVRYRFINASHRSVVAVKLEGVDVRVMAIDSRPAEPFSARNGALVLAPGTRIDAFVDMTGAPGAPISMLLHDGKQAHRIADLAISKEPPIRTEPLPPAPRLPSNGMPAQLDLKNAQRFELVLQGPEWVGPTTFSPAAAPAFRAKPGRVVVLALTNRAAIATIFHLHGHHFRLLDRLDDGWKPYWLDTLAFEPGQTQRIAFLAEYAGHYLLESVATDWAAPRLVRWYAAE
jgi:FtsP/CotA-like multicopper oxidase with cupredoxin domain